MDNDENLLFLAGILRANGGDPEAELRRVLVNMTKRSAKAGRRIAPLLEMEKERRREREEAGLPVSERRVRAARHPMNATHRKKLQRTRAAIVPFGYVHDPEKKATIWAVIEKAEKDTARARLVAALRALLCIRGT